MQSQSVQLLLKNLPSIKHPKVQLPSYAQNSIKNIILHIGPGNFHKSHQAFYTDLANDVPDAEKWGIYGVGFRSRTNDLSAQDNLYSLVQSSKTDTQVRVIQCFTGFGLLKEDATEIIKVGAAPSTKIISMTITEKGYSQAPDGSLDLNHADVKADIQSQAAPITSIGLIAAVLKKRMDDNSGKITVLSCDNLQHNGDTIKGLTYSIAGAISPAFLEWVKSNVSFPNSMVDRIAPGVTPKDIEELEKDFGIIDKKMIKTEDFYQWVLEEDFIAGRPAWDKVGAIFTNEVKSYEQMKLRLLNGGHSTLCYSGYLTGQRFVDIAMAEPALAKFVRGYMNEVTSTVPKVSIELGAYKDSLIARFSNPNVRDSLIRIALDGSKKMKEFIIPNILDLQKSGGDYSHCIQVLATWARFSRGVDEEGNEIPYEDGRKDIVQSEAKKIGPGNNFDPKGLLEACFGAEVAGNSDLVSKLTLALKNLENGNIKEIVAKF